MEFAICTNDIFFYFPLKHFTDLQIGMSIACAFLKAGPINELIMPHKNFILSALHLSF